MFVRRHIGTSLFAALLLIAAPVVYPGITVPAFQKLIPGVMKTSRQIG